MMVSWISFVILVSIVECFVEKNTVILNVDDYEQPDDVDDHYYLAPANDTTSCTRECVQGDYRVCYYEMVLENYAVLSAACRNCINNPEDCYLPQCVTADGFEKGLLTANRRLPGPGIHVCYGDWIIVDINNMMLARSVTIHWHGIKQVGRSYMDGVPFVNQCPILDDTVFRYAFRADHTGTNYWHAHSGLHMLNGLQGNLVVRQPKEQDPVGDLYDYDLPAHTVFVLDWYHTEAEAHLPGLIHRDITQDTTFYLINGKGRYTMDNGTTTTTPYQVFRVRQGASYRFRLVAAICTHCPARFIIEGHKMIIIATDGTPVNPVLVDVLEIYSGERYDFVLHATKEVRSYWILVRGMDTCFKKDVFQLAIIRYEGSKDEEPLTSKPSLKNFLFGGVVMNPKNATCGEGQNAICVTQLQSLRKVPDEIFTSTPDYNHEYNIGLYLPTPEEMFQPGLYDRYLQVDATKTAIPMLNNISYVESTPPLLMQHNEVQDQYICPLGNDGMPTCPTGSGTVCNCTAVVPVKLGSVVQIVLIDRGSTPLSHPFHLHGHAFNVLSMGYLPPNLMNAEAINGLLKNNQLPMPKSPVFKDTVAVPSQGYAVFRFIANNPGVWFFHCHFPYHHTVGMATAIRVGTPSQFPPLPKGFPRCGDYTPPLVVRYKERGGHISESDVYKSHPYK